MSGNTDAGKFINYLNTNETILSIQHTQLKVHEKSTFNEAYIASVQISTIYAYDKFNSHEAIPQFPVVESFPVLLLC